MQTSTTDYWVAKFGGTSMADFQRMSACAKIIADHPNIRVVVVSAQAGVTNLLIQLNQTCLEGGDFSALIDQIKLKVQEACAFFTEEILSSVSCQSIQQVLLELETTAKTLARSQNPALTDEILAIGERIAARLFTGVLQTIGLPAKYQDARMLIKTNQQFSKAEVFVAETKKQVAALLLPECEHHIVVTEGFIGTTLDDRTTTLGRGGSDYSAALLAEAMGAQVLQIWTDVSGVYTVDPRLIAKAQPIKTMCFTEAAELAQFGAKVLHPATLWPAIRQNIPVFVGSSLNPAAGGTWIVARSAEQNKDPLVSAIALRKNQSLLTINSLEMLQTHGFLAKIFTVLARHELSVDVVTTSEVSVALTLNHIEQEPEKLLTEAVLNELKAVGNVSLTVDKDLCLIALVGNQLHKTQGVFSRLFNKLSDFNIRLICHGASAHNLCFLVDAPDALGIIKRIHTEFFE